MHPNALLRFADDIRIVVPDSLNLISTYVLREQGDWFEDELRFVRSVLRAGQQAIDIGANYGVFTLSIAKVVGSGGKVWAFEPASSTAALLSESLALNGFGQVVLDRRALSDKAGVAQLSLHDNAEFNELVRGAASGGAVEAVTLISLDEAMQEYGWEDVDFVKIDAEGEEAAIIRGGRQFLHIQSPLIQYEVKAGETVHLDLVRAFAAMGYQSYRLVPGLGSLVPFDIAAPVDGYLLNLFCCKADRAAKLAAAGRLAPHVEALLPGGDVTAAYGWRNTLVRLPYGRKLEATWLQTVGRGQSAEVEKALALYALAHDSERGVAERYGALRCSLEILAALCAQQPEFLRLASLARVAQELGDRTVAVDALDRLLKLIMRDRKVHPEEPFLSSSEHFDRLEPREPIDDWVLCSVLEGLERSVNFSSFYSGQAARQRLKVIASLGYGSPEMARRLTLVEQRFPDVTGP